MDINQVKKLRDKTGISIMQCRKALEEAGGDFEKAEIILQKQSKSIAQKKSDRELNSGTVQAYIHSTGAVGALVEISCETDFVSKNEDFKKLAYEIAMHITAANPEYLKREDVSESAVGKLKEVFMGEVEGKPEDMKEKILQGKIDSYLGEKILLEQNYIKDPDLKIGGLIESAIQKFGEKVEIRRFARFSV